MKELKYIIEDSTIIELLGRQNFTNKESAVLELVKNSYDAGAPRLDIILENNSIIFKDNGFGMDEDDIENHWMHIGKSDKGYSSIDKNDKIRVLSGSKGIGRFALARLGSNIKVISKKENKKSIEWTTDWNTSNIEIKDEDIEPGTTLIINDLRDKWKSKDIKYLITYLSKSYNDTKMDIFLAFDNQVTQLKTFFDNGNFGLNYTNKINLYYNADNKNLEIKIESDEFQEEANKYCKDINLAYYENTLNMIDEFEGNKNIVFEKEELTQLLKDLGCFHTEFYFSLQGNSQDEVEKFLYKYKTLPDRFEKGIILYRNAFSISSYNGEKDWLDIRERARKSPAAATHESGSWRVRVNQLSGKVIIDKNKNKYLVDLSNRQGLEENIYYKIFTEIINYGLKEFERHRQNIIKQINIKNKEEEPKHNTISDKVIKNPKVLPKIAEDKTKTKEFIEELKENKKIEKKIKKEKEETEEKYKYDIRILNAFATSGLKATSIAHELKNDKNNIVANYDNIKNAMKKYQIWDIVTKEENRRFSYNDIPSLLENNKKINHKIMIFINNMLENIEKKQFKVQEFNVYDIFKVLKNNWCNDYSQIKINLNIDEDIIFKSAMDNIRVIMDNLILNSIQQNENKKDLIININCYLDENKLFIEYKDNGKGLPNKYLNNPIKILEVHESSRTEGHGIGMWIVNNSILMTGGKILDIKGNNGFYINFYLGDKINGYY